VTLLVDTYDTKRGVRIAADVLSQLADHRGYGVRLDSGDLGALDWYARRALDAAGLTTARIVVSLDEYSIDALRSAAAPGGRLRRGNQGGHVRWYALPRHGVQTGEYGGRPVMKLSSGKGDRTHRICLCCRGPGEKRRCVVAASRGDVRLQSGVTGTLGSGRDGYTAGRLDP
jgi:hypothetical protein